jgi:hypothetical protein
MPYPLPCPFCGQLPGWRKERIRGSAELRQLVCTNPDCKLEVYTRRSGTDDELIVDWNTRAHPEQAPADDQVRRQLRMMLKRAKTEIHGS